MIEIFKVKRNYREFVERLGRERSKNNNEYLPYSEVKDVAVDNGCLLYTSRCV